jgi:hypothetical protein
MSLTGSVKTLRGSVNTLTAHVTVGLFDQERWVTSDFTEQLTTLLNP